VNGRVSIEATARDGETVLSGLHGVVPWRPRVVPSPTGGAWARVLLVQSAATLLAGDVVVVTVRVGPRALLEIGELGALLIHSGRGGPPARITVEVEVEESGRIVWNAEPVIVASGARAERSVLVRLASGAVMVLSESTVLGRSGEKGGGLLSATRIDLEGRPLLNERLDTEDQWLLRSAVVMGSARMLGTVVLAGTRDAGGNDAMQLHGAGTVWRGLGDVLEVQRNQTASAARFADVVRSVDHPGAGN
jgi:urease accessory protein